MRAIAATAGLLLGLIGLLGWVEHARSAPNSCDPDLRPPSDTPYAYRQRGPVCEGLYARDIGGRAMSVVALTSAVDDFALDDGGDLLLDTADVLDANPATIHLRAEALRPKLYYRMDAETTSASLPLRWPPRLLKALALTRRDIGLLAWAEQRIGGESRRVLFPVRLRQSRAAPQAAPISAPWQLAVLPLDELNELYFSVTPLDEHGADGPVLVQARALGLIYYPPYRPVAIALPTLAGRGVYRIDISADLRAGRSATDRIWVRGDGR